MDVEVRFLPSGARVEVAPGTTLWVAARRAGLPMASACGADGICGRCGIRVLKGAEALSAETGNESEVKRRNRIDAAWRLACRAEVAGPVEVTATYW